MAQLSPPQVVDLATSNQNPIVTDDVDLGLSIHWFRVLFTTPVFPEPGTTLGDGATVTITPYSPLENVAGGVLRTSDAQTFNATQLPQWVYGSAFFNDSCFQVKLVAGATTTSNRVIIERVLVDDNPAGGGTAILGPGVCGNGSEDREAWPETRVGRLLGTVPFAAPSQITVCTAFLIDECSGDSGQLHLTAGHCFFPSGFGVIDRNLTNPYLLQVDAAGVPDSLTNCTIQHPPPYSQFPVNGLWVMAQLLEDDTYRAEDWGVFRCHQSTANATTFEKAGMQAFQLAAPPQPPSPPGHFPSCCLDTMCPGYCEDPPCCINDSNCCSGDTCCPTTGCCETMSCTDPSCCPNPATCPAPPCGGIFRARVTGFGQSPCGCIACSTPQVPENCPQTTNHTRQSAEGCLADPPPETPSSSVAFRTDVCVGNSGSPIIWDPDPQFLGDYAIGIATAPLCQYGTAGNKNSGTAVTHTGLERAICALDGVCGAVYAVGCHRFDVNPSAGFSGPESIALRVTSLDWACLTKFVQADGTLGDTQVSQTITQWASKQIHGLGVAAGTHYRVEVVPGSGPAINLGCTTTHIWGDADESGIADVGDLLCALAAFSGNFTADCTPESADLSPCPLEGGPDGYNDVGDVLAALDVVFGVPYSCADPCSAPGAGGGMAGPMGGGQSGIIILTASSNSLSPGTAVDVDMFVTGPLDVRGYQGTVQISGGRRGTLSMEALSIDEQRADFVFLGEEYVNSIDVNGARLMAGMYNGGVNVGSATKYFGSFKLRASSDALGTFNITPGATTLLRDSINQPFPWTNGGTLSITVE